MDILQSSDLYLSTALWEGLPFAAMEAMGTGMPLLLHDAVGNRDLIYEGKNGHLFTGKEKATDHILNFYNNKSLLEEYGNRAYSICKQEFSVQQMTIKYMMAYQNIQSK